MSESKKLTPQEASKKLSKALLEYLKKNELIKSESSYSPKEASRKVAQALTKRIDEYKDLLVKMRAIEGSEELKKSFSEFLPDSHPELQAAKQKLAAQTGEPDLASHKYVGTYHAPQGRVHKFVNTAGQIHDVPESSNAPQPLQFGLDKQSSVYFGKVANGTHGKYFIQRNGDGKQDLFFQPHEDPNSAIASEKYHFGTFGSVPEAVQHANSHHANPASNPIHQRIAPQLVNALNTPVEKPAAVAPQFSPVASAFGNALNGQAAAPSAVGKDVTLFDARGNQLPQNHAALQQGVEFEHYKSEKDLSKSLFGLPSDTQSDAELKQMSGVQPKRTIFSLMNNNKMQKDDDGNSMTQISAPKSLEGKSSPGKIPQLPKITPQPAKKIPRIPGMGKDVTFSRGQVAMMPSDKLKEGLMGKAEEDGSKKAVLPSDKMPVKQDSKNTGSGGQIKKGKIPKSPKALNKGAEPMEKRDPTLGGKDPMSRQMTSHAMADASKQKNIKMPTTQQQTSVKMPSMQEQAKRADTYSAFMPKGKFDKNELLKGFEEMDNAFKTKGSCKKCGEKLEKCSCK